MLKLYRNDNGIISYWETWDKDAKTGIIHWGIIGDKGQSKEVKSKLFSNFRKAVDKEILEMLENGYKEVTPEEHYTLLIEYAVDGMGTPEDIAKRHRLQSKMDEVLGWTGLGHCDGGSMGSGTMEVCCYMVDLNVATATIKRSLNETEFSNYTRIYHEDQ